MYTIPEQFYRKTIDWAAAYASEQHCPLEQVYNVIVPHHTLHMQAPKGLDPPRWPSVCHYDEAFVAAIPNGRLVTGNCYVVTPDNKRLYDAEYDYSYPFHELPDPMYIEETVATLVWGWNIAEVARTQEIFGHWFFDILPRIHLLEQSEARIDRYVIGKLNYPFQYESLQMLGFPLDKLIQVDRDDFHLQAWTLVVPAVPVISGKSPLWAYQFIRSRLKDAHPVPPIQGYEKIYITRQDAQKRYVINEDEVMNLLASKGFTCLVLAPLSTLVDDYFWRISNHAQLDYYELVCDIELPPQSMCGADNIIVNLDKLNEMLQLAGM